MLVVAVQFVISKSEISELFLDDFYRAFYDFGTDAESTKFVNYVQKKFHCCGSENSTDWDLNKPYVSIGSQIPDSCCKPEFTKCDKNDAMQIYAPGCAITIMTWSTSHSYIFLLLWLALILLSCGFCFLLKLISKQGNSEAIVDIKSLFSSSESEHLMNANKKLLDYQNSFTKCNPRQVQIGFTMNDDPLSNGLNSNMNKLTRYSQIRYSKVKPVAHQEPDEHAELTCHQEHRDELTYVEESSSISSESSGRCGVYKPTKPVNSCDKLDKISQSSTVEKTETTAKCDQRNELHKTSSIKSIDRADKPLPLRSIRKQSTNKPNKQTKDSADCKSNPNYDPHYKSKDSFEERSLKESSNLSVTENSTKAHSPSSTESSEADELTDHRNLIPAKRATTEKTMYNLDKLKNKFIDPYSTASSYWTADFDEDASDEDTDVSSRRTFLPNRLNGHRQKWFSLDSSFDAPESEQDNSTRRQNICSDCGKILKTRFKYQKGKRRHRSGDGLRWPFSRWIGRKRN